MGIELNALHLVEERRNLQAKKGTLLSRACFMAASFGLVGFNSKRNGFCMALRPRHTWCFIANFLVYYPIISKYINLHINKVTNHLKNRLYLLSLKNCEIVDILFIKLCNLQLKIIFIYSRLGGMVNRKKYSNVHKIFNTNHTLTLNYLGIHQI